LLGSALATTQSSATSLSHRKNRMARSFRLAGRLVLAGDDAPPPVGPWGQAVFQPFEIKNRWSFERFRVSARAGEIV